MPKLIVANWKLNPQTFREAEALTKSASQVARNTKGVRVILCPPFVWLTDLSHKKHSNLEFGAQDVFWEDKGAYTGEISPMMLKNSGAKYVILGHSERRRLGETDEMISKKMKAVLRFGLKPILCVGEGKKVRRRGIAAAKRFVEGQLVRDLEGVPRYLLRISRLIVAYEPVWAISSQRGAYADIPESAAQMAGCIKSALHSKFRILNFEILYGGSVTSKNISGFMKRAEFSGVLVGSASVKPEEFKKIIKVAVGITER